jgi:hypothetical protein
VNRSTSVALNGNYKLRVKQTTLSSHPIEQYTLSWSCANCDPTTILNCVECSGTTTCSVCVPSYYADASGVCTACPGSLSDCTECSSSTVCTACETNFILDGGSGTCRSCIDYLPGCLTCDNQTHCTSCNGSFILDTSDNTCRTCEQIMGSDCIDCTLDTCLACSVDTFLYQNPSNNSCISCDISECLACNQPIALGDLVCVECITDYLLENDTSCYNCS